MELLGSYQSSLVSEYYFQLLALLNSAISAGDLSGGSAFNQSSLLSLEVAAQSFSELPTGTANSRVTDDSFNYPLSLLQARLNAIQAEVENFTNVSGRLLDVLTKETILIDQLLGAVSLSQYVRTLPQISDAWSQAWDFSISQGPVYADLNTNPDKDLTNTVFDCSTGSILSGLRPATTTRIFPVKYASWKYNGNGIVQTLYPPDFTWAQLDVILNEPSVNFELAPASVILPQGGAVPGGLELSGQATNGILPTYLRLMFYPRSNTKTLTVTETGGVYDTLTLSSYAIDTNVLSVMSADGSTEYALTTDFTANISQAGTITPTTIPIGTQITSYFTEYWPAYQCSLDQINWSPIVMLDPKRMYPDNTSDFYPIDLQNGLFPITDEAGIPTGIYFGLSSLLAQPYTLLVTTTAGNQSAWGPTAILEVDVDQPSYMTTLFVSPFTAFPMTLTSVQVEGLTTNTLNTAWSGSLLLEQPTEIQFPRQIVSKIYLTFVQNNYTIKEYQDVSSDSLRRTLMSTVESTLPIPVQNNTVAPIIYRGYQYEWGLENIVGFDRIPDFPTTFVQGPYVIPGHPDVIRFDADMAGVAAIYLCWFAYSSTGTLLDSNTTGILLNPGTAMVFPFTSGTVLTDITSVQIGLEFVLSSSDAVVSKYCIQTTLV